MARILAITSLALVLLSASALGATSTFDDLTLPGANTHYFPPDGSSSGAYPFSSGGVSFNHDYTNFGFSGCCSIGWSYSNHTDATTPGFGNQYSAYAGGGQGGSANYAIGFDSPLTATLPAPAIVSGAFFTNSTYAALSMRDGDSFSKKFGGTSGSDADFFKLTITGFNDTVTTGSVDFYLADFRFADNSQDYIVQQWTFVNLASLGAVTKLGFTLASSDNGTFGMNTPAYFALDTLTTAPVPEPSQYAMLLAGLALLGMAGRKRAAR